MLVVAAQLVPGVPEESQAARPAAATTVTPTPPPVAVDPAPYLSVVDRAGPTEVGRYDVSTDTVWGPQGSPYIIRGLVEIAEGASLTLLPGTVVKLDTSGKIQAYGQLLSLGTPKQRVIFTSLRDDTVVGDTNGDGAATAPAPKDWDSIVIVGGDATRPNYRRPVSFFDHTDIKYGGQDVSGCTSGALNLGFTGSRAVVTNSVFVSTMAGVRTNVGARGFAGIYNSLFESGNCGITARDGNAEIIGNTFGSALTTALYAENVEKLRFWYNTAEKPVSIFGIFADSVAPSPPDVDARYNALLAGYSVPHSIAKNLTDWSGNWFGRDANAPLPACMDPTLAAAANPPVKTTPSTSCPAGQAAVVGYQDNVLPALSASPQVLPTAIREAAAPRYGPVNLHSGVLTYQAEDVTVQDAGKQVTATRTFRSDKVGGGDAGKGWTSAYSEALSTAGNQTTLALPDGTGLGFVTDPKAGYAPAPGVSAGYTKDATGTTVTTPGQTSYRFNPAGELTGLTLGDSGHEITVQRAGGQVSRVTGESGRYLTYTRTGGRLDAVTDQSGRGVTLTYTGERLTGAKGVDGHTETYQYDGSGRLAKVITPEGRVKLAAGYRADGRVDWIEEQGTGRTTIGYDDANGRRTVTRADGTVLTQTYDWAGRLVTERSGASGVHLIYDGEGRLVSRITGVPAVPMTGYGPSAPATLYDRNGDPVMTVDEYGAETETTFNSRHQPLVSTFHDQTKISRSYDTAGRLDRVVDPNDKVWTYDFNDRGQLTVQIDPLGRTRTLGYETDGDLGSVTDESNATTVYGNDAHGLRTSVTDPLQKKTVLAYTAWGELRQTVKPRGGKTTVTFNRDRQPTSVTDPQDIVTSYGYDTTGRLDTITDAAGKATKVGYDAAGRIRTVTDPRNSVVARSYTPEGWVKDTTDARQKVTRYAYDPMGRLMRGTTALNQTTQTQYDRSSRVLKQWTPDGALWVNGYNAMGRHTSVKTPRTHVWAMEYDPAGNLTKVTDPLTYTSLTSYDAVGRVKTTTDQENVVTTYNYDDAARSVTVTDALGTVGVQRWDAAGRPKSHTDGSGITTTWGYDDDGNRAARTDPAGTSRVEYNLAGQVTAEIDASLRRTDTTYDTVGRLDTVTHPGGAVESFDFDEVGNLTSHTDRTAKVWGWSYNAANLVDTATDPRQKVTTYTYDDLGRQSSVTDAAGVVSNTAYDPVGRPAVRWDARGASWVTRYDLNGDVAEEVDPAGVTRTYFNDKLGRRERMKFAGDFYYTYDKTGRMKTGDVPYRQTWDYDIRGRIDAVGDAYGKKTTYDYDGAGRQTLEKLPTGRETTWTYDAAGRLDTARDGLRNTSAYDFDPAGRLSKITLPRGGVFDYTYDAAGLLDTETDPARKTTSYDYDPVGRWKSTTYPSGRVVTADYDPAGRQNLVKSGAETREFGYDDAGRLTSAVTSGRQVTFDYDDRGLLESSTDALGTTGYEHDLAHRLAVRTPPAGAATTYGYSTTSGRLSSMLGPFNVEFRYDKGGQIEDTVASGYSAPDEYREYDDNGRLTVIDTGHGDHAVTYHDDGQVKTVTAPTPGGTTPTTTTYTYDGAGRLDTAVGAQGTTVVSSTDHDWDADGNRTAVRTAGKPTISASYDLSDRITSTSTAGTHVYDVDGNLKSTGDGRSYSYGPFGELTGATTPAGTVSYGRDALGRVASRTSGGVQQSFSYEDTSADVSATRVGSGPFTQVVRTPTGLLLGQSTDGGTSLRTLSNPHGDVTRLVDDRAGKVTWSTGFDPFGTPVGTTGTAPPAPVGFQAMYTDPLTGLVDMGARHYDPGTGRFTQSDTVIGALGNPISLNRYLYANADPVSLFDPDGHWPRWLNGLANGIRGAVGDAINSLSGGWDSVRNTAASAWSARRSMERSAANLAAEVATNTARFWNDHQRIGDTATGVAVGAAIVGGCVALGVATAGVGGAICLGAAVGAVIGGATCDSHRSGLSCAGTGAAAGGVAGLTGGLAAGAGGGALAVGAVSGFTGDATEQLLSTGTIDTRRLAGATVGGAVLGKLGGRLVSGRTASTASGARRPLALPAPPRRLAVEAYPHASVRPSRGPDPMGTKLQGSNNRDCASNSFTAGTPVLMADGTSKPIEQIRPGDKVIATDPETGKRAAKPVTATITGDGEKTLIDIDVTTSNGDDHRTERITATDGHPFWIDTDGQSDTPEGRWIDAADLRHGQWLKTSNGQLVKIAGTHAHTQHATVYNLTVADIHTYYVIAGNTPVLVHNCGGDVALGTRAHGLREFADGNGYTHYLDSPSWQADVRAAVNDPNTRLHIRLDGFRGATPAEKFTNAYRSGMGDNWYATEWEMYKTGLAVRVGNRSWDSITFYDGGKIVNFPQPPFSMPGG
ncbi:polymorphic toxin-type HINT domain-containing protein [Plantactinospora sp. GCM10030261]|uniref:polymorphic toxin-type HINT domain-containing protein n=1 Tax=Plantactinospora sp. GCM10030261 TaxID=3273420 RepID=UPI003611AFD7